jgi:uncharacterized protein YbbK (DUF523 family)
MSKILVSACLLGEKVRYHGGDSALDHPILERWRQDGRIVPICPETAGGLPTPRPPAELQGGDGDAVLQKVAFVRHRDEADATQAFVTGAEAAVALAREHGVKVALLKNFSPSCGTTAIYDGTFTGTRIQGEGVTAAALRHAGVTVFGEHEIERADEYLRLSGSKP